MNGPLAAVAEPPRCTPHPAPPRQDEHQVTRGRKRPGQTQEHDHQQDAQRNAGQDELEGIAFVKGQEVTYWMPLDLFLVERLPLGVRGAPVLSQVAAALPAQDLPFKGHGFRAGFHDAAGGTHELFPDHRTGHRSRGFTQRAQTPESGEVAQIAQEVWPPAQVAERVHQIDLEIEGTPRFECDA